MNVSRDEMTRRLKKLSSALADLKQKPSELKTLKVSPLVKLLLAAEFHRTPLLVLTAGDRAVLSGDFTDKAQE